MSIASEITRLQTAKADIKAAIEDKGVTVPSAATLDDYADYVSAISGGGGGGGVQSGTFTPTERTSSVSFDCGLTSINVLLIVPLNESPLKSGGKTFVGGYYSSDLYYKYFLGTSNNAGSGMQAPQNGTDGQPYELNGTTVTVYSAKTVPSVNAGSFETITYKWYAW